MTKYEWETELKKNIHRLPPDEIKRVMEYYGELFDDYAERGKSETEIVFEFGNPVDVADKILSEYVSENGELPDDAPRTVAPPTPAERETSESERQKTVPPPVDPPKQSEPEISKIAVERDEPVINAGAGSEQPATQSDTARSDKSALRVAVFVLLNIATGFAFFIAAGVLWIVIGALAASGAALAAGGAYTVATSIGVAAVSSAGSGIAQIGMGIAAIGIGIALTVLSVKLIKLCAQLTKKLFIGLRDWLTARKETV